MRQTQCYLGCLPDELLDLVVTSAPWDGRELAWRSLLNTCKEFYKKLLPLKDWIQVEEIKRQVVGTWRRDKSLVFTLNTDGTMLYIEKNATGTWRLYRSKLIFGVIFSYGRKKQYYKIDKTVDESRQVTVKFWDLQK